PADGRRVSAHRRPRGGAPAPYGAEVTRRMRETPRRAADRGVTLMLENEKGIYGDTAARVLDILETVDSPSLAHAFDPANYLEVGQSVDEAWTMLRHRVGHFHVKDYSLKSHKNVPAGQGDGQIPPL